MRQLKITNRITRRESIAIDKYLNEISKIPLIDAEKEAELARLIRNGDQKALKDLTEANLRFVVSVAKQYQNQGLSLSDLINEGNVGLIKAAKRFDETKGFKFISYAVWWIRQSILQAIVEYSRMVRLPLNKINAYNKINKAYLDFIQEYERKPSMSELAVLVDMDEAKVEQIIRSFKQHISMDAPVSPDEDSGTSLIEFIETGDEESPDIHLINDSTSSDIIDSLSNLSPRERDVIVAYYGLDGNTENDLKQVGEMYGLSTERVRQIKSRALRRLRSNVRLRKMKY